MPQVNGVPEGIFLLDTITKVNASHQGFVVVGGSHGAVYAGYCAAKEHVRAVILNDAGVGKNSAGISSLSFLDGVRIAAATADSRSCRIADAADMWSGGRISYVNETAKALGCAPGQLVAECAELLQKAPVSTATIPAIREARFTISERPGRRKIIGIDSASLFKQEDAGHIVITGSHGGLVGGKPDAIVPEGIFAAVYNDAGGCKDGSGYSRLPVLDERGVLGMTVSHETACMGDARSTYAEGIVSRANHIAQAMGVSKGMRVVELVERLAHTKSIADPRRSGPAEMSKEG